VSIGGLKSQETYFISTNNCSICDIDTEHVAGDHQPEMLPNRVQPHVFWILGVSDADVPRNALYEADARPVPEYGSHMYQDVFAMLVDGFKLGDAYSNYQLPYDIFYSVYLCNFLLPNEIRETNYL
jgi:hypothetical protein